MPWEREGDETATESFILQRGLADGHEAETYEVTANGRGLHLDGTREALEMKAATGSLPGIVQLLVPCVPLCNRVGNCSESVQKNSSEGLILSAETLYRCQKCQESRTRNLPIPSVTQILTTIPPSDSRGRLCAVLLTRRS